jgi:S-adenosylmethionine hydrolase
VFAPVAAALAAGTPPERLGAEVPDLHRLQLPRVAREPHALRGQVIYVDHFGNLVTNVSETELDGLASVAPKIAIGTVRLHGLASSYSAVERGQPLAVVNSWGLVEIAVREGSARERLGVTVGEPVVIEA